VTARGVLRVGMGLVVASAAAAGPSLLTIPLAMAAPSVVLLIPLFGFCIAFSHAVLLGLPLYLLAARRGAPSKDMAMAAGTLIGAIPVAILIATSSPSIIHAIMPAGVFGFCGCFGAMIFHGLAVRPDEAE